MLGGNPPPAWGGSPLPSRRSRRIVRAAIHPAIGIARVGNSPDEFARLIVDERKKWGEIVKSANISAE